MAKAGNRSQWRIAVLPGDGVGPEVMAAARQALEHLAATGLRLEPSEFPWPSHAWYQAHGAMAPDDWLETLGRFDALLLGALGDPGPCDDPGRFRLPDHVSLAPLLELRRHFELWACERPAVLLPGAPQFLADPRARDIDMLVIRENSEGEYSGHGGRLHRGRPEETATQVGVFTRRATARLVRHAFHGARRRAQTRCQSGNPRDFDGRASQVCLVTKRNAMPFSGELYTEVFEEAAAEFPDVATSHELVDAACMKFVTAPWRFDVVVASNLHGDILTDLAAVLCGGMGIAPSANLNPDDRLRPPLFEPTHGSGPDIAGRGSASPYAMLLTTATMLGWMGEEDAHAATAARRLRAAIAADLAANGRTPRATREIADAVCARL